MDLQQKFLELYDKYITRPGFSELRAWLVNSDFFEAPASTRFHGSYAGGLLEHSLNVYECLKNRVENDPALHDEEGKCIYSDETVAIAALLHDVCKVNFYKKDFKNVKENGVWVSKEVYIIEEKCPLGYHADKSIIILQQFIKLTVDEIMAIRAHMGGWDEAARGGAQFTSKIFDQNRLAVHLHIADMEASYLMEERN